MKKRKKIYNKTISKSDNKLKTLQVLATVLSPLQTLDISGKKRIP